MSIPVELEIPGETTRLARASVPFLIGGSAIGLVALLGYGAFLIFAGGVPSLLASGYLAVAVIAGAGAFFSPCAFPLLPSYFAYVQLARVRARGDGHPPAFADGLAAAAGVATFNVLLGAVFALAGLGVAQSLVLLSPNPSTVTVALRYTVGSAWLGLGIVQLANVSFHGGLVDRALRFVQRESGTRNPSVRLFLYGFAYTIVGIGCTAPFLATVIVLALASGGFLPALAAFLVFALTMSALMIAVSWLSSGTGRRLLRDLSERTPAIKRGGGVALAAFGVLLLVLTTWPSLLQPLFP